MKKKVLIILGIALAVVILAITAIQKVQPNETNEVEKRIEIIVANKENIEIYNQSIDTKSQYLIDAINEIEELDVISKDDMYGAYITSIMGIEQGDNYYWTYYIDGEYALTGVSNCKVEDGKTYSFKIEEYIAE